MSTAQELPYILDAQGCRRPLGHVPPPEGLMRSLAPGIAAADLIPDSEWEEFYEWPDGEIPIKDQNGFGACNGHDAATGIEVARYIAGMPYVGLSAWWVYGLLTGGRDSGSNIGDALELVQSKGVAPESLMPWGKFQPRNFPAGAAAEAARFKAEIGNSLATYEEIGTAVMRRESVSLAVCAGNAFTRLDADGVPGLGWGYCNHAVHVSLGMKHSKAWGWCCLMTNSWTASYGIKGHCWLPLKKIVTYGAFEAYTVKAVADDPQDKTRPVLV